MFFWKRKPLEGAPLAGRVRGDYPTEALRQCESFCIRVADRRKATELQLRDFLIGVYLAGSRFPELRLYWKDFRAFEEWALMEHESLPPFYVRPPATPLRPRSSELERIFCAARDLAGSREIRWHGLPVLSVEHVLYTIACASAGSLSVGVAKFGLDVERLGQAVRRQHAEGSRPDR